MNKTIGIVYRTKYYIEDMTVQGNLLEFQKHYNISIHYSSYYEETTLSINMFKWMTTNGLKLIQKLNS